MSPYRPKLGCLDSYSLDSQLIRAQIWVFGAARTERSLFITLSLSAIRSGIVGTGESDTFVLFLRHSPHPVPVLAFLGVSMNAKDVCIE